MKFFEIIFPLTRTHCGVPLGNGNMGVLVWGGGHRLCLTLNRGDLWDHRQGEQILPGQSYKELAALYDPYDVAPVSKRLVRQELSVTDGSCWWRSSRLPVGRFELELKPEFKLRKAVLEYSAGVLNVFSESGEWLRLIHSLTKNQLLVEDMDGIVKDVICRPAWEWVGGTLTSVGYQPPAMIHSAGISGWFQACPDDPGVTALCRSTDYGLAISLELGYAPVLNKVAEDFQTTLKACSGWWKHYWDDAPEIRITDDFLNRFYKFAMYKFACATHPDGVACSLQGPWLEEYQRAQWSCDYHFNVNIQQIYTLAFATGKFEHLLPLFDMLESDSFQQVMRNNARNLFGIDDGLLMTHAVDDRGYQCGGISTGSVLDFACGGWTAQLYWLYYKYTQDKGFLRKRAYPFIYGIIRVFEETLDEYNGRLSIPLSISAEYGCIFPLEKDGRMVNQNTGRDPSNQLSCIHMLADILLEVSEILHIAPRPVWQEIKQRVPECTLIGEPGSEHIAIWEGQDLDVCHRHHSHLACIYPFDTLKNISTEQQHIIDNTVDHWILKGMGEWSEWCYPWAAIIQARLGFKDAPALLLNIWKDIFINEGLATVYLPKFRGLSAHRRDDMLKPKETTEIMQLDGTMAGATAIIEMLVHEKQGVVHVFPAVPDSWLDISFKNIRLPGAFLISAERKNGKMTSLIIKSLKGGVMKLKASDNAPVASLQFYTGEEKDILSNVCRNKPESKYKPSSVLAV